MRLAGLCVALAAVALAIAPASAEHEVIYRYTVVGYVKDAKGKPIANQTVRVVREKTGLAYEADTDAEGLYLLIMRLGDERVGETLTMRVGDAQFRLTATFDPKNQQDERGTRVDLEGTRWLERAAWFPSTLSRLLAPAR